MIYGGLKTLLAMEKYLILSELHDHSYFYDFIIIMNNLIIFPYILSLLLLANSFKDDPYEFGIELRALAENNGLNFLHKEVDQTVNNHTLQFFGITRKILLT